MKNTFPNIVDINRRFHCLILNRNSWNRQKCGFHYIFEDRGASGFSLLYPNEFDAPRSIIGGFSVPSGSAKRSYRMTVDKENYVGSGRLFRALMLSSKAELAIDQLTPGVISRERMARLKEQLEPWQVRQVLKAESLCFLTAVNIVSFIAIILLQAKG